MNDLEAILVDSEADLEPFIEPWQQMAEEQSLPFCQPAWMLSWWRHVAPQGAELRVVIVLERNEFLGVAPFWLEPGALTRKLSVLGSGVSSNVDILGELDRVDEIAQRVVETLASTQPSPTSIVFSGIRAKSPWPSALATSWPSRRPATTTIELRMPAPVVPLGPHEFDQWLDKRSSHFRARMRRGLRKLDKEGGSFRRSSAESMLDDVDAFIELHHERWSDRGGSGVLTVGVEKMLREIAQRNPNVLDIWSIDAGGAERPGSVQIFVEAGQETSYWLGGFDDTFSKVRPGPAILTVYRVIEQGFAGAERRLDLGSGGQDYKYEFADEEVELHWIGIVFSPLQRAVELVRGAPLRLRIAIARQIPSHWKRRMRKAYGTIKARLRRS